VSMPEVALALGVQEKQALGTVVVTSNGLDVVLGHAPLISFSTSGRCGWPGGNVPWPVVRPTTVRCTRSAFGSCSGELPAPSIVFGYSSSHRACPGLNIGYPWRIPGHSSPSEHSA